MLRSFGRGFTCGTGLVVQTKQQQQQLLLLVNCAGENAVALITFPIVAWATQCRQNQAGYRSISETRGV